MISIVIVDFFLLKKTMEVRKEADSKEKIKPTQELE